MEKETKELARAEIAASGNVQGVGFRYFIQKNAEALLLTGYVKNLFSGEVLAVVEGEKWKIELLIKKIKLGPSRSSVTKCNVSWSDFKDEFHNFGIRY
jgi:acylphosphatase